MIANVTCQKCGATGKIDVGPDVTTVEVAQAKIDEVYLGSPRECPFGRHVELGGIKYVVDSMEEGKALSDEEFVAKMRADGYDLWTTDELSQTEIEITSFAYGMPMAKVRGKDFVLDFVTAPSGKRYYYARAGEYAAAVGG